MPHQCVKCSKIIPSGSKEILEGCNNCKSRFFFYFREDQIQKIEKDFKKIPIEEKNKIEADIRDIVGITDEQAPIILDIESVRIVREGKFEIDVVKLFQKDQPLIYKLEEGKYIIDLATTLKKDKEELGEKI